MDSPACRHMPSEYDHFLSKLGLKKDKEDSKTKITALIPTEGIWQGCILNANLQIPFQELKCDFFPGNYKKPGLFSSLYLLLCSTKGEVSVATSNLSVC